MKKLSVVLLILFISACSGTKTVESTEQQETSINISEEEKQAFASTQEGEVRIGDEETEYEIIIIDPGFNAWLQSIARPEGYYSQSFLETRNRLYVITWNQRALGINNADPDLYQLRIDYEPGIDYGYEVNYKLYNYFIYFQRKYNQRLGPFLPRI